MLPHRATAVLILPRLLFQLGLHRVSTYAKIPGPPIFPRIAWHLFASVSVKPHPTLPTDLGFRLKTSYRQHATEDHSDCVATKDLDLQPLELADYEDANEQADLSLASIQLAMILGRILDMRGQDIFISSQDVWPALHISNPKV
jgi:hypothetical protein